MRTKRRKLKKGRTIIQRQLIYQINAYVDATLRDTWSGTQNREEQVLAEADLTIQRERLDTKIRELLP